MRLPRAQESVMGISGRSLRIRSLGLPRWLLLSALLAAMLPLAARPPEASASPPGSHQVVVHLFEWKWTDVARECTTVLGPKGYGGVQVSPPQEHVVLPDRGYPWWQRYQPISYQLTTRSGSRQQFADMVAAYHNDLLSLGVDGFRIDAAKHMPAADIANILSRLSRLAYIYQEVIFGAGEPIQPNQYEGNGDLLEFRYGQTIGGAFKGGQIAGLQGLGTQSGWELSGKALVFTDNHDTQRSGAVNILTYKDGQTYTLANVFELAWPYGTPVIMSSFSFSNNDAGPPGDGIDTTRDVSCGNGWVCE